MISLDSPSAPVISALASSIAALASIVTAILALLVFREARKIRRLEWISQANLIWNDFNKILLQNEDIRRLWIEFLSADEEVHGDYKFENKVNWIIFCHLNILVTSIYTRKQRRGDVFFKEILEAEFRILWKRRKYISELMESTGYDPVMRIYFRDYCEQIEKLIKDGQNISSAMDKMKSLNWLK
jgi:hypothetical protein